MVTAAPASPHAQQERAWGDGRSEINCGDEIAGPSVKLPCQKLQFSANSDIHFFGFDVWKQKEGDHPTPNDQFKNPFAQRVNFKTLQCCTLLPAFPMPLLCRRGTCCVRMARRSRQEAGLRFRLGICDDFLMGSCWDLFSLTGSSCPKHLLSSLHVL